LVFLKERGGLLYGERVLGNEVGLLGMADATSAELVTV
jgi:hypothetical protein